MINPAKRTNTIELSQIRKMFEATKPGAINLGIGEPDFNVPQNIKEAMKKSIKRLREYGKLAYPCGEKFFRRAASIEKRLEKMEVLDKPKKVQSINLNFNFDQRSGNDIVEFNRFNFTIGDKELFKNANLFIRYKEKVCL